MNLTASLKLLRDYADHGDEAAFRKLVEQYINLVYSVAVRRVGGDVSLAEDVTQTVFTDLARKASSLRGVEFLGGWLHRHTGFVAANMIRSEQRRQIREQEAFQMNATDNSSDSLWQQLAPVLDDTIESLDPSDRQVILLRFFERWDFRSIGTTLGISDDAAQKRLSRALDKLRTLLTERGVTLSVMLLSSLIAGKAIAAAPDGLVGNVARIALSGAGAGGGLGLMLLKLWKSLSFKIALGGTAAVVALWLHFGNRSPAVQPERHSNPTPAFASVMKSGTPANDLSMTPLVPGTNDMNVTSNVLLLNIVAADSGKPVPNVEIDYWSWRNERMQDGISLESTRFGVCKVPISGDITELKIVSLRDGFAATRLDWRSDSGDQIPVQFTLRLARAVSIGGQVVGPDGNPVAGAQVHFEPRPPSPQTRPQSDDFPFNFNATTDAQGHWQMDRIGKEAFQTIHGDSSHPDFVGGPFVNFGSDPDAEKQLLAGTYVFTLRPAVVVRGVVTGPNGQSVSDANVLVGRGPGEVGARRAKSGNDGTFSIPGCRPGKNRITAEAEGYAAKTIEVELSDTNSGPFQVSLNSGKVLKLRVMDEDGNPVPHADVTLDLQDSEAAVPRSRFDHQTDADGRLEWTNAPDAELTFIVSAPDTMVKRDVKVQPDGIEHVITLQPALTVSGTVTDATTGQSIPRFRIVAGWPETAVFDGRIIPHWSQLERDWFTFGGGKFQFSYHAPMVLEEPNPVYMFKFEADGYAPFVTRAVHATERSVHLDVALTPAATTEVTVFTPDQKVATGTQIGLVSPGAGLVLIPGGFSRTTIESATATATTLLTTDNQGRFALSPDPAITEVVAASPQGYSEATPKELAANPVMNLTPWGRLEGTFVSNGIPISGRTLSIGFGQGLFGLKSISCGYPNFQAKTDDQGRFTFAQVPTGDHMVTLVTPFTDELRRGGWSATQLQQVTVSKSGITTVTIDTANLNLPSFRQKNPGIGGPN